MSTEPSTTHTTDDTTTTPAEQLEQQPEQHTEPAHLDEHERVLVVETLRERAASLKSSAATEARDVIRTTHRDARPAAMRLAQRLALAADLEDLAAKLGQEASA